MREPRRTFRAESQKVLMTLSRQAAIAIPKVDLNAIQFMVMATAKLTRTSNAIRESLKLIVAQMVEAAAVAPKSDQNKAPATPGATPTPGGTGTPTPGGANPVDKSGQPAQRLPVQPAAMQSRAAERRPEGSAEHPIGHSNMQRDRIGQTSSASTHIPPEHRIRLVEALDEAASMGGQSVQRRSPASADAGTFFVQRDPHGQVVTAINTKGYVFDREGDFKTAWSILNSLNMADMLATMEALRLDGNLGTLMGHQDDAKKFNVPRLMAAVHAVNLRATGKSGDPGRAGEARQGAAPLRGSGGRRRNVPAVAQGRPGRSARRRRAARPLEDGRHQGGPGSGECRCPRCCAPGVGRRRRHADCGQEPRRAEEAGHRRAHGASQQGHAVHAQDAEGAEAADDFLRGRRAGG